jgi:hypothetical protein
MSATGSATTGAAMLVPLSVIYGLNAVLNDPPTKMALWWCR